MNHRHGRGRERVGKGGAHGRYIMGRNAIREVLNAAPHTISEVFAAKGSDDGAKRGEILSLLERHDVAVTFVESGELTKRVGSDSHQGFVALMHDSKEGSLKDLLKELESKERSLVVLLDSIIDPQNLGAILRASECFGVDAVIWSKNRCAPLSAVAAKASAGASELVPIVQVSNLADASLKLQEAGFALVGADAHGEADLLNVSLPQKIALIMGSEESGIQDLLLKRLEWRLTIPMKGAIDSLNVSQAAAVFLYALSSRMGR